MWIVMLLRQGEGARVRIPFTYAHQPLTLWLRSPRAESRGAALPRSEQLAKRKLAANGEGDGAARPAPELGCVVRSPIDGRLPLELPLKVDQGRVGAHGLLAFSG